MEIGSCLAEDEKITKGELSGGQELLKNPSSSLYTPEENKSGPGEWLQRHII
jgi:hypothetical protein